MKWKPAAPTSAFLSASLCFPGLAFGASADHIAVSRIVGPNVVLGEFGSRPRLIVDTLKITDKVNVTKGTKTLLATYAVFNPSTCKEIDTGAWSIQGTKPKEGEFTLGYVIEHPTSGPCVHDYFWYAGIYYEWKANTGTTDTGEAIWNGTSCPAGMPCSVEYKFTFYLEK